MTDPGAPPTPRQQRARLAEVFGEVLPELGPQERTDPEVGDEQLRRDVPPHHG
jgi:hypothetical protein